MHLFSFTADSLAAIGDGGLNLGAVVADIQPENGQLELQANARLPDSRVAVPSGGSGRTGVPSRSALLSTWVLRSPKFNRTRKQA